MTAYQPILPEIVIFLGAMFVLLLGVFRTKEDTGLANLLSILVLIGAAALVYLQLGETNTLFNGSFVSDGFAQVMKILTLLATAVALFIGQDYLQKQKIWTFEFPVMVLLAVLGMMVMISAHDLIALYLGVELQSLALYVIAAFHRDAERSSEAGLKYFVLGALSSGLLLYGASLIYGFTGETEFAKIAEALKSSGFNAGFIFGLVFLLIGLAFKISAVPFHMWTPDVYEGAPTPVTSFFAAAPKIAAMALIVRVTYDAFPAISTQWRQVVVFLSIGSMLLGAFAAIGQTNIKRLMAYSSISHMGFVLVGLAAGSGAGLRGVVVYLIIYAIMTLGTFAVIMSMRREEGMVEDINQLAGLARNDLPMAFILAALMFSLAGIPWLAGFFAKFYVFMAAIEAKLYILAVIGVIASVIGAFYYLRIVKLMFFDDAAEQFYPAPFALKSVMIFSGLFSLLYVFYPTPLVEAAELAARTFYPSL